MARGTDGNPQRYRAMSSLTRPLFPVRHISDFWSDCHGRSGKRTYGTNPLLPVCKRTPAASGSMKARQIHSLRLAMKMLGSGKASITEGNGVAQQAPGQLPIP